MSDLIDRQDAIELFESYIGLTMKADDAHHQILYILSSLPSAEPERKWIPVTEALPEDNRQVLVYAQSTHFVLAKYDEMMEPNGEWKKQWVTFDAWKPYYTVKNVIAWMPLPEPWRGE